ncbi:bORF17 [Murid betaherpesvirus 8]|uniref:BORF17 n=1 Tax=Rat cytomegalovirus (isolate England) TaxID=1261657 RepID=A0A0E3X4V4_RCMVE|nr:bORF17 [Murid betaherpesvirus 8]WPH25066.1 bORF17 [Murid betaherpesvirus 8]WPH25200.1 bORF17 [Murid betaherpesvirus 8]
MSQVFPGKAGLHSVAIASSIASATGRAPKTTMATTNILITVCAVPAPVVRDAFSFPRFLLVLRDTGRDRSRYRCRSVLPSYSPPLSPPSPLDPALRKRPHLTYLGAIFCSLRYGTA